MSGLDINDLFSVRGKTAVVTGGGTGIGRLIAEGLAANGATVYIVSRRAHVLEAVVDDWEAKKEPTHGSIVALPGDLSSKDNIADLVARYRQTESKLDILVNNAGVFKGTFAKDVLDADAVETQAVAYDWNDFDSTFDVNLTAMWFTTAYFLPLLRRSREEVFGVNVASPIVINISSGAGLHIARMQMPAYSASKAGVNHLTQVMAGKFIPLFVRAACICPGMFPSEMTHTDPQKLQDSMPQVFASVPSGRPGTAHDISGPIIMLSSRAGAYINGAVLAVDGGRVMTVSASEGGSPF